MHVVRKGERNGSCVRSAQNEVCLGREQRLSPPTIDLATVLPTDWQRASRVCHHVDVRTGVEHFESTMEPFTVFMCGDTSRCGLWRAYLHDDDRRWWANESLLLFFFEQDAMLLEDF